MKVCFFAPKAYGYFNPELEKWAGGAETQQFLIARQMVDNGIDVSFIVGDHGQPEVEIYDGIEVVKSFALAAGNRKLRFLPDMLKIRRAMEITDADIFNQRSTSFYTGQMAFFASRLGKKFTFSIGSDYNCFPDCDGHISFPMTSLYRYGIKKADAIIAQTERQRTLIRENMSKDSVLIRNGIPILHPPTGQVSSQGQDGAVGYTVGRRPEFLWVGTFRRLKRPELFLRLAEEIPEADFTLVGGGGDESEFSENILRMASSKSNLSYVGFKRPDEIEEYYRRAFAYVNTSDLEGFPNTYLHSWRHGVPTLTIEIDPDSIIENNRIGYAAGNFDNLVKLSRELCADRNLREEMSLRSLSYVSANHDIREKGEEYIRLFRSLLPVENG